MIRYYNHLLGLSILTSLTLHLALFLTFCGGDEPKKATPAIPISLVYSESKRAKPLPLPIPKPIEPKKEIQNPAPLPLIKPLEAKESFVPEESPIIVPKVEHTEISAPTAVIQEPILGKERGEGMGGEGTQDSFLEPPEEPPIFEVKDLDEPLKVIKYVRPEYPSLAGKDLPAGLILLKILVNQEGEPAKIEILKDELKAFPSFSTNAKRSVRQWRFSKPMINKSPVCVWYILPMRFKASR